jgi:heat shock protein HslJ
MGGAAIKNRKLLLPALFSIVLVFSLIFPVSVLNMTSVVAQENVTPWDLEPVVPPSDIENVTWGLETYSESSESGKIKSFQCSAINATFEGGRTSGYAGCNWYEGDYELKGNNLSITRLVSTERWCGEFVNKIEQAYLTALRDAESYEIEGGKLRINCGNRLLVFNEGYSGTEMWHRWWPMEWLPWTIVAAAVVAGLVILFVRRRKPA